MPNQIQLAHSPDTDDIFIYFAIKFGWVDTKGYTFRKHWSSYRITQRYLLGERH